MAIFRYIKGFTYGKGHISSTKFRIDQIGLSGIIYTPS